VHEIERARNSAPVAKHVEIDEGNCFEMLFALRAQADRMSAIRLVRSMVTIENRKKSRA
jgi:hypothetical protein